AEYLRHCRALSVLPVPGPAGDGGASRRGARSAGCRQAADILPGRDGAPDAARGNCVVLREPVCAQPGCAALGRDTDTVRRRAAHPRLAVVRLSHVALVTSWLGAPSASRNGSWPERREYFHV